MNGLSHDEETENVDNWRCHNAANSARTLAPLGGVVVRSHGMARVTRWLVPKYTERREGNVTVRLLGRRQNTCGWIDVSSNIATYKPSAMIAAFIALSLALLLSKSSIYNNDPTTRQSFRGVARGIPGVVRPLMVQEKTSINCKIIQERQRMLSVYCSASIDWRVLDPPPNEKTWLNPCSRWTNFLTGALKGTTSQQDSTRRLLWGAYLCVSRDWDAVMWHGLK